MRRQWRELLRSTAAVFVLLPLLTIAPVPASSTPTATAAGPDGRTSYLSLSPDRLADTRNGFGFVRLDALTIRVQVTGRSGVPSNARAAVLNVAVTNNWGPGYVSVYPAGTTRPVVSNVNTDRPFMEISNMATVQLGSGGMPFLGAVDIYTSSPADLIIDVAGAYVPVIGDKVASGRLITRDSGAYRVLDTRLEGSRLPPQGMRTVDTSAAGVPATASAVVVNIAAVFSGFGYWSAGPLGADLTRTASLNIDQLFQTRSAQAIVQLQPGSRSFNVFSWGGGELVVDVAGWITGAGDAPSTDGQFVPRSPTRVYDTRNSSFLAPWNGSSFEVSVGNWFAASAVAINLAGTQSWDAGYVTAYPAGQPRPVPEVASLNFSAPDQTIANHVIARIGQRGLGLFVQSGAHVIVDVAGWYTGAPSLSSFPVPQNPFYWPNPAVRVVVPKLGINLLVATGTNLDRIADAGHAATFPSMINVASPGNMMLFGHRTSAGGPFRYLNELSPGDVFSILGSDGRSYNYRVTRLDVVGPTFTQVFDRAVGQGPITAQLVACHPPGSVRLRIVATGRLFSVT
jgi:hypothetical protein